MAVPDVLLTPGVAEDGGPFNLWLSKAPHILVAGMTGSGKSALIHKLLCQLISYKDEDVGLVMIDPKRVEFARYAGLPHLLDKPVYELGRIRTFLEWTVNEMMLRFGAMEESGDSDIVQWNERGEGTWSRLVVVIDELANLILADRTMERPIVAIASMGRAAGVHLIMATQRPSADVITGLIRANVPTRFCLPVVTKMDSRIVLDETGAEELEKPGDILARIPGKRNLVRMTSPYQSDDETARLINIARVLGQTDL